MFIGRKCMSGVVCCICFWASAQGQQVQWPQPKPVDVVAQQRWVDSVFSALTLDERIAQFFMVAAYSNKDSAHVREIDKLVRDYKVGGLIFMQGNPYAEAVLTNRYQSLAKVKLLISIDGEWGLQMRLKDSTLAFPKQLTLGALKNDTMIYQMGEVIGQHCRRMGIHVDFAPDVDVNSNPLNPVIGDRSFGESPYRVANKGLAYMNGLQHQQIMACAKHFPGHGDADSDSHLTLPTIHRTRKQLDSLELYPFRALFQAGVQSVMAAHLNVPALDDTKDLPTSLSYKVVTTLMKGQMGFKGLVFSDALNMKGVSNYSEPGAVAVEAFKAGNDVLLFAGDVPKSMELFKKAIKAGALDTVDMYRRLKVLLAAKYNAGLANYEPVNLEHIYEDLNTLKAKLLRRQLFEQAITLCANTGGLLPITVLDTLTFASLSIANSDTVNEFQAMLGNYAPFDHFNAKRDADSPSLNNLYNRLCNYKLVIVGLHDVLKSASKAYGISDNTKAMLSRLAKKTKVVIVNFGTPYSLKLWDSNDWVMEAYEDNTDTREAAAEAIFGAIPVNGSLPVTASSKYPYNTGLKTKPLGRFKYTLPEEAGINSEDLKIIDRLAAEAICDGATPGCQILVARNGKVIYNKAFGYQTYDTTLPLVKKTDLYDIASVTKIAATTPLVMNLYDKKVFELEKLVCDYVPGIDTDLLANARMSDILTHQAGLRPFIPFYKRTLVDSIYAVCYKNERDSIYCVEVRKDLFMRKDYKDTMYKRIYTDTLEPSKGYVYSDLDFYLLKQITESLAKDTFVHLLDTLFYKKLGLATMCFNPLRRFPLSRIAPTEDDREFRKTLIHGYVHDPGAAMLGGVSGHAGLFCNANDLATMMQMLLNKGNYAGKQYISATTVDLFTARFSDKSRRGLGFDKPETEKDKASPCSSMVSPLTFGHQGFTGTCTWVDPKYNLVIVFLSNRIYPNAENKKLTSLGTRTKVQDAVYEAILKGEK